MQAAHAKSGAETAVFLGAGECGPDAGDKTPARRAHVLCCILCSANDSDKFAVALLTARTEFQTPKTSIAAVVSVEGEPRQRRSFWVGSSSSRGPPRFS
ncbi:hypothetical protein [Methylocystis borbori]|uniref:hypothetical protein n=1 Tax=Methylocystis borbori TaxID=3118750 RepID=UPI0038CC101F